ncbi:MAG: hypothetical protein ABR551_09985 [Gemmatimonadales bacterium]
MFRLVKWYLDLVTDEGTVVIVYAAALRWPALRLRYLSTFLARPREEPVERSAWSGVALPDEAADTIRVDHAGLGLSGQWHRAAPSTHATLLVDTEGSVQWDCLMPSATARVVVDGNILVGAGYVERLTLTRPPWSLPFRGLRWGRYTGASRSATWIDLQGDAPRRWVWLDGVPNPEAIPDAIGLHGPHGSGDDWSLRFTPDRELLNRQALQVISQRLPVLHALPLGPFGNLHETKYLARGSLHHRGTVVDEGWVIHEQVTW